MIAEMVNIAVKCLHTPTRSSVWSSPLGKYVCVDTPDGREALAQFTARDTSAHPPINPEFKLVFLTAVIGTVFFIALCLVLALIAGKEPRPLFEKVILGFLDLAKIGFGAVAGLLGGKKLAGEITPASST